MHKSGKPAHAGQSHRVQTERFQGATRQAGALRLRQMFSAVELCGPGADRTVLTGLRPVNRRAPPEMGERGRDQGQAGVCGAGTLSDGRPGGNVQGRDWL